jgi:site-specific recombinase XerD
MEAAIVRYETVDAPTVQDWRRQEFGRQLARASVAAESQRRVEWQALITAWLELKESRSKSEHTRRNYQSALLKWQEFLTTQFVEEEDGTVHTPELWEVDHSHVRSWQSTLRDLGRNETTINWYLACVSSFYSFVINEKRIISGVEIDLFTDRLGRARQNPFKAGNIQRGRHASYERAATLTAKEYDRLLTYLEEHNKTLAGARNHALILSYLHTGWRSAELLRMKWGEIRPSKADSQSYVFQWRGKGAKSQDDVLPRDCYDAIVNYLKLAGRWIPGHEDGIADSEYVWLPVAEPDMSGLANGATVDPKRAISPKSALRILRQALKAAGIPDWQRYRIHDLRHTHAHLLLETGANLAVIQARLHHSSLATTGIYVKAVHRGDPVDGHTAAFRQLRMTV